MIGRRQLPEHFRAYNRKWGAPHGHREFARQAASRAARRLGADVLQARAAGPFAFQLNNDTRWFEYPWAFHATPLKAGMKAVDVGGSLGGFQFTLADAGLDVLTVDPGEAASMGWPVDVSTFRMLNKAFGTDVELRKCFLQDAGIPDSSVDRVFCISTIEHIPDAQLPDLMAEVARILSPGGKAVLTVDVFFDLAPFTNRAANQHGHNVDVRRLVEWSGLTLEQGDPAELVGFPGYDPQAVLALADDFARGSFALNAAQAVVLGKSGSS